ncbi:hypothetical protein BV22DRAFT_924182 [Leucogyrophana mollusca]|uniref:Uncharacterized protein n=1 Tax=Leucogyrophana mollusca TaxID=85980 RepID=A0ACB8AWI9_9AGAM|nr:hypothetical protein BV22DRAFT_924182 [Leucogyrophana mollusca]
MGTGNGGGVDAGGWDHAAEAPGAHWAGRGAAWKAGGSLLHPALSANQEHWTVPIRQTAVLFLQSVADPPQSKYTVPHLTVPTTLLGASSLPVIRGSVATNNRLNPPPASLRGGVWYSFLETRRCSGRWSIGVVTGGSDASRLQYRSTNITFQRSLGLELPPCKRAPCGRNPSPSGTYHPLRSLQISMYGVDLADGAPVERNRLKFLSTTTSNNALDTCYPILITTSTGAPSMSTTTSGYLPATPSGSPSSLHYLYRSGFRWVFPHPSGLVIVIPSALSTWVLSATNHL